MRLYIDSANLDQIERMNEYYPIAGVTTNPSILVKEKNHYIQALQDIRKIIGEEKELFIQVIADNASEIVKEAEYFQTMIPGKTIIKIPVTEEGIKAIKTLTAKNVPTLATTIYTPFQALIAAKAGAKYVAPYVNRIDDLSGDGIRVVSEIATLFTIHKMSTELLAASFKNVQQVYEACLSGAHTITVAPEIIEKLIDFPATARDVKVFQSQWKETYGNEAGNLLLK
ncbi:transaldolase family protein [Niallia sp.]|uniref:transaldolase family protein n=1 Tax=Niallia sp. TaxID=2837523 RepID=UPI00289BFA09|nr:transaldolase family protein [Niallia sp.]